MKLTQPITGNGLLTDSKDKVRKVPVCNWGPVRYPLPSECNTWIKLFENLRDNFTDSEIEKINNENWLEAMVTASGLSKSEVERLWEVE